MPYRADRRVWGGVLWPTETTEIMDIIGRDSWRDEDRLHWTMERAKEALINRAREMRLSVITWDLVEENFMIGRCHKIGKPNVQWFALLRGGLLPLGNPPAIHEARAAAKPLH